MKPFNSIDQDVVHPVVGKTYRLSNYESFQVLAICDEFESQKQLVICRNDEEYFAIPIAKFNELLWDRTRRFEPVNDEPTKLDPESFLDLARSL